MAEIELAAPLEALSLPPSVTALLALVRSHGRPVGLVRLRAERSVSADALRCAIAAQVEGRGVAVSDSARAGTSDAAASFAAGVSEAARRGPWTRAGGPRASVVVCTHQRPDDLCACLEALRPHAAAGHQIVVVDNAPGASRSASVATAFPCTYVREPRPGLDRARNRGVEASRGEIVAFTDDDCRPDAGWLDALLAPYADPAVSATTGLVMPLELQTPAQERFEAYCANRRQFRPRLFRAPETPPSAAGVVGMGANMSFRRTLLEALGGFDPRFDGGMPTLSGGDTEFFARVLASGASVAYSPDALVWHRHRRDLPTLRRVVFGYGVGLFAMLAKRLIEDGDRGVLFTAPRWLAGPPLKAAWNALRRRPATSLDLVLLELLGALAGPLRYVSARRRAPAPRARSACPAQPRDGGGRAREGTPDFPSGVSDGAR